MEQNIDALKRQLSSIGFEGGLEYELRCRMCFQTPHFTIQQRLVKGSDVLNFLFYFQWDGEEKQYCCPYYDAILRKDIPIPDLVIGDIQTHDLDQIMATVDWSIGFINGSIGEKDATWERENRIAEVVSALAILSAHQEGREIADRLRMKYWADWPPQQFISGLATLKSRFEISQRFYFCSSPHQITLEDAYRFLSNKWMEKKLLVQKKMSTTSGGDQLTRVGKTKTPQKRNR